MTPYKGAYSQRNRYRNYSTVNGVKYYSIRVVANNTNMGRVLVQPEPLTVTPTGNGTADTNQQYANYTANSSSSLQANSTTANKKTGTFSGHKEGTSMKITAFAKPGYRFKQWNGLPQSGNWPSCTRTNPLSFLAQCDLSLTAVFEADPDYRPSSTTVTVNAQPNDAEMGSVTPTEKTIEKGAEIALTATNKAGYHFVRWDGVGNLAGNTQDNTSKTIRIRPQTDINAVAVFAKDDSRDPEDPNGGETPGGGGGSTGGDPFSPETPSAGGNAGSGIGALIRKYWWAIAAAVLLWYLNKEGKL